MNKADRKGILFNGGVYVVVSGQTPETHAGNGDPHRARQAFGKPDGKIRGLNWPRRLHPAWLAYVTSGSVLIAVRVLVRASVFIAMGNRE